MSAQSHDVKAVHAYWQARANDAEQDIAMARAAEQIAQNSVDRKLIKHFMQTRCVESEAYRKMANATKQDDTVPGA